jgi:hypothetical protein
MDLANLASAELLPNHRSHDDLPSTSVTGLLVLLTAGCAHPSASPSASSVAPTASSGSHRPCDPGSSDSTAWHLVAAKSFTFRVPSTWRVDAQTASFQAEKLRWGTGERPRNPTGGPVTVGRITVERAAGSAPPSDAAAQRLVDDQMGITRETETIDGRRVEITRNHHNDLVNIGATWTQPRVWFSGEAASNEQANTQLAIIRSVRFTTQ